MNRKGNPFCRTSRVLRYSTASHSISSSLISDIDGDSYPVSFVNFMRIRAEIYTIELSLIKPTKAYYVLS